MKNGNIHQTVKQTGYSNNTATGHTPDLLTSQANFKDFVSSGLDKFMYAKVLKTMLEDGKPIHRWRLDKDYDYKYSSCPQYTKGLLVRELIFERVDTTKNANGKASRELVTLQYLIDNPDYPEVYNDPRLEDEERTFKDFKTKQKTVTCSQSN